MTKVYPVFTLRNGQPSAGAKVQRLKLASAGIEIPALVVGEEGRGRKRGVMAVELLAPDQSVIVAASLGLTRSGNPKMIAAKEATPGIEAAIVVMPTNGGFRGGVVYTGDLCSWKCDNYDCLPSRGQNPQACGFLTCQLKCTLCGYETKRDWEKFPGQVLVEGNTAEGDAGRAGSHTQIIALVPAFRVFRTGYRGRTYGNPQAHYSIYNADMNTLVSISSEDRRILDQW